MDIKILKDKKNSLLNRRELDFVVKYEDPTPVSYTHLTLPTIYSV